MPLVIVEGMLINAESVGGQLGDLFPYDVVILLLLDSLLYIKLNLFFILEGSRSLFHVRRCLHVPPHQCTAPRATGPST